MKIKDGLILKEVAGSYIVVPIGGDFVDFSSMITLNDTGAFLWKNLEKGSSFEELVKNITAEYDISPAIAKGDVESFLNTLKKNSMIDSEQ